MTTAPAHEAATPAVADIHFILNGQAVTARVDPERSLLDVLREEFDIVSPKNGCAPQAQCGCCTVMIDGKAKLSCAMKVKQAEGRSVTTLEGIGEERRTQLSAAFAHAGAAQCGFCTPGFAMRAVALADEKPAATRADVLSAIRPHLCRCTGYTKIIEGIELYTQWRREGHVPGEAPPLAEGPGCGCGHEHGNGHGAENAAAAPLPLATTAGAKGGIGARLERYHAREFVLGEWHYVDDIKFPGMRYAGMCYSAHPRALVKGIDASAALAMPGVHRVLTAADIPGDRIVGLIYKDWPVLVAVGEETRYEGDVIAVVVADTQRQAREAAAAVVIDYEVLEPVTDPEKGIAEGAPKIHPKGNLLSRSSIKRGDAEAALAASAHVVEETFQTQFIEHMFLEPESCIAVPEERGGKPGLHVYSQGQGVFDDQRQIAQLMGWELDQVHVELVSNGGGFGGKEDMTVQGRVALAAALTGTPIKCTLSREESIRMHPKRHPLKLHFKLGCDAEGHLTGLWAHIIGDKGAYASVGTKVIERAAGHATGPYKFPNVAIESLAVYTNNPPCGAMRGFGANQAAFAVEQCLNMLAEKVGLDGWDMRERNILGPGDTFCTGQRLDKPFGLRKTLLAVKDQFKAAKYAGIACGIKNVGIGNGMPDLGKAVIRVDAPDSLSIRTGFTEMGQGYFTVLIQTAVQETGLPPGVFKPTTDTSVDVNCGQTTASRATVLGSAAVVDACIKLREDLQAAGGDVSKLVGKEYRGDYACTYTSKLGADVEDPKTHLTYGFATQVVILDDNGLLKKVIAAHDVGKVMNPTMLEGQMQGSLHMGLGYALTEDIPIKDGRMTSRQMKDYGVLRAHHMPEMELIFIEVEDPETPYGCRGVGEIGLVPTAPAVAGALAKFEGHYRTKLPMKDSNAARAIWDYSFKVGKA